MLDKTYQTGIHPKGGCWAEEFSVPLAKEFWSVCEKNMKMTSPLPERQYK
jgi:hypothetical protein